jgi:DNA repair protein RecN (Recombination protein N)
VLHELRVENLLLMDRAELRLGPGLNVLTGETGAGKTLLAQALDLLLGGRARAGLVRGGAKETYVEGVFLLSEELAGAEVIPDGAEEIVLARRVWPDGRTRSYVCGRSATVADLRELGSALLSFYGQHEHRKLMLSTAQLEVLDAHCGVEHLALRERVGRAHSRVRELQARAEELRELAGARERELDLLAFELGEIEAARPSEQEAAELAAERERLRHLDTLRSAASAASEAVNPEADGRGAAELLAQAVGELQPAAAIDPALTGLADRLEALRYEAEDVCAELRAFAIDLDAGGSPQRLEHVEERLALFARLERKHGGSIADVLRHAECCQARIQELERAEIDLEAAERDLASATEELERQAALLSERRERAAPALAAAVRERLAELAMSEAEFAVDLRPRHEGCGPRGADTVELLIAPNPGIPAAPLREIASGGELSRVMLALLSVAQEDRRDADEAPTLVFDEIDAGVGGHTARAVGEHLRALASRRQLLCITHLPQVAALASRHFAIRKDTSVLPATTTVTALDGDEVVMELVRMLGASEGDAAASRHARQLRRAA